MGYIEDDSMVRVDFFKPSGKWKYTIGLKWTGSYSKDVSIHLAFKASLRNQVGDRYEGLVAFCLEPYHEHSHPISVTDW